MDGSDLELKGLSLIDEDDCLIDSSHQFDTHLSGNQTSPASFKENGAKVDGMEDGSANINRTPEPLRSCESGTGSDGKYNLRQSLAWDSAFFTNAGVLDSEELTSIIEGAEKKKKQVLPRIQEETQKSTDSISTLESDSFSVASLEGGLFEDIRASIQKSSGASNAKSISKAGIVVPRMPDVNTLKKVGVTSLGKLNSRPSSEKPSSGTASTGKTAKPVNILRPRVPQPQGKAMAKGGASVHLLSRQSKSGRDSLASTSTKRDSTGGSHIKVEKDNAGSAISRRATVSKVQNIMGSSRSNLPKPNHPSSRSSPSSVVSKEPATSCSSLDSSGSALSDNIAKLPLKTKGRNVNSKTKNSPSTGPTLQTPRKSSQPSISRLSAYLMAATKHSSNISPASSISEWSVESSSSTSTVNQRSNSSQTSFDTSSSNNVVCANGYLSQDLELQINSQEKHLVEGEEIAAPLVHAKNGSAAGGALLLPNSMKPTGLRMPSPKIGYFDGVKSRCSPNSSKQSNPVTFSGSPKVEAEGICSHGGLTKGKNGRLPSARMTGATVTARPDSKQMASGMVTKSREPSNAIAKVSTALRNVKRSPGIPATFQTGMYHKCKDKSQLKVHGVEAKRCDANTNLAAGSAEKYSTRDEEKSEIKFMDLAGTVKVTSSGHGSDFTTIEVTTKPVDKASAENERLCRNFESSTNTEKLISDGSSMSCQGVTEHPSPRNLTVLSQKESLSSLPKISPSSSPTRPIVVCSRVPFTVKDSLTNVDSRSDFSRLTIPQVEKNLELRSSDRVKENC